MDKLEQIKSNKQNKYEEIIRYLKQDNGYWLENDKWEFTKEFFIGENKYGWRFLDFSKFGKLSIKNEVKFYLIYNFKNKCLKDSVILPMNGSIQKLAMFIGEHKSFLEFEKDKSVTMWNLFLRSNGINSEKPNSRYIYLFGSVLDFIKDFYDDREETEKDIWRSKNIRGVKVSATSSRKASSINFASIPIYYRDEVKRYFITLITKKSWSHCTEILNCLNYFFNRFYSNGYEDGFIESLSRQDIEKYLYWLGNDYKDRNATYRCKFVSYIRIFLEYIQMAQYDKAPKKQVSFLIFQDDIPKRERPQDSIKRIKFIPGPILEQLDINIMDLDRSQFIPIYILLRETGWRCADILNLRYDNCLEQIWNSKEQKYNYYLHGEIVKTETAQLKIPIRDKVAEMLQKAIDKAQKLSTEENNPKKYLFNTYEGRLKEKPLNKATMLLAIQRLIKQKDIRDVNGELYHFRMQSLRHTRVKECVELGMGISTIQQILGYQSLQMAVHYAVVGENKLYKKWKDTEDLNLFRVNTETNKLEQIDLNSEDSENLIRYEYVKKNLDAVRVPFGVCFKASKIPCKQQMNHCLTCSSFCTTVENIPKYEEEIDHVKKQIDISERYGRELWAEKNKTYLKLLEDILERVREQKILHKNGASREEVV